MRYAWSLWGDYKKRMHSETRFSAEEKRSQRLVMTLLVKNEEILLRGNLNFHLAQGVDHILVTDHGSTDATREILKEYEARGVVTVIEETSKAYHQKAFVNRMVRLAIEKYGAEWVINGDADEFFYAKTGNLKDGLPVDARPNILFCRWNQALPRAGQRWQDIDHFYVADMSKAIHTAKGFLSVSGGNHKVYLKYVHAPSMTEDIILYHLQSRDFLSYKGKLENKYNHCLHTREKSFPEMLKEPYRKICLQDEQSARAYYNEMLEKAYQEVSEKDIVSIDRRFSELLKKAADLRTGP